jgi:hypothetical protein
MSDQRRVRCLLALALLVVMEAIAPSFGAHALIARADTWVTSIWIDDFGGAYSGYTPCSGCNWPGMTLTDSFIDQYGQWSDCCHAPTNGDYVPYNPNVGPSGHTGSQYIANAPYSGHGTSGWFIYKLDQPLVSMSGGADAVEFQISWSLTDTGLGGALAQYCYFTDANGNNTSTNYGCTATSDQDNGGCTVPDYADYCVSFNYSCTETLFNCADGPAPPERSSLGRPEPAANTVSAEPAPTPATQPVATGTPRPTETQRAAQTATPTAKPEETATPRSTETPKPNGTATPKPSETATPRP